MRNETCRCISIAIGIQSLRSHADVLAERYVFNRYDRMHMCQHIDMLADDTCIQSFRSHADVLASRQFFHSLDHMQM